MNTHKRFLLISLVAVGIIVGGSLTLVSSGGTLVTGIACGGLIGGLLYCIIQMAASRRKSKIQPYDQMDEQYPIHHEIHQTRDARVREMQDNLMADIMHFPPPRR